MSLVWEQLEAQRARQEQVYNNGAREGVASLVFETRGEGEAVTGVIALALTFTSKPIFTTGIELVPGSRLVKGHYPNVSAGVGAWHTDSRGFYVGVELFFVVDTGPLLNSVAVKYRLQHHMEFRGTAIKLLPAAMLG